MLKNIPLLFDSICEARENTIFFPQKDTTFCNYAVDYVAAKMGYTKFKGLLANKIVQEMRTNGDWLQIQSDVAQYHANQGALVIAGAIESPHGHVAIVRPGLLTTSGKWDSDKVPKILNIGKDVFLDKGVSWGFGDWPSFFVLKEMT